MTTERPRVFATLYGGASYAAPDRAEEYPSTRAVLHEWQARRDHGRTRDGLGAPCWGDGTRDCYAAGERATVALIFHVYPDEADELGDDLGRVVERYPDAVATIGPRGGLRIEPA